ncbi:MAG: hypothetical protein WCA49_19560 [Candidatus Sulfotelmatobacter sp.]
MTDELDYFRMGDGAEVLQVEEQGAVTTRQRGLYCIFAIPAIFMGLLLALPDLLAWLPGRLDWLERGSKTSALRLLDAWGAILPIRIAKEDLGDYMEDIGRRADKGQQWLLWLRVITALVWTGINAMGFVSKNLLGKDVESRTGKQPSK